MWIIGGVLFLIGILFGYLIISNISQQIRLPGIITATPKGDL